MILYIDTKDQKVIKVSLKKDGKMVKSLSAGNQYGSQVLLPLIKNLLQVIGSKSDKYPQVSIQIHPKGVQSIWKILDGIEVETGPGSFTGLRVGVSVANALGYSLGIPVNGKKIEDKLVY
mgnify:CR=1 FL=1